MVLLLWHSKDNSLDLLQKNVPVVNSFYIGPFDLNIVMRLKKVLQLSSF